MNKSQQTYSGMIRREAQIGEQKRLARRPGTFSVWFNRDEHGVEPGESCAIVRFKYPSLFVLVVLIENAKAHIAGLIDFPASPGLERAGKLHAWLLV